jgi:hypothetical protein
MKLETIQTIVVFWLVIIYKITHCHNPEARKQHENNCLFAATDNMNCFSVPETIMQHFLIN